MTLNTFDDLSTGLQNWLEDDGAEFVGDIPDVIDLAEKRLLRDLDLAIFRRTDSALSMTISQAIDTKPTIAGPDLLIATKQIYLTGGGLTSARFLVNRSNEFILDYNNGIDGIPKYYGEVSETQWIWGPTPVATYTVNLRYLSRPDPLATGNQTNWLSDNAYDILFKAALAEAEQYLKSDERVMMWTADYNRSVQMARKELYNLFGNQADMLGSTPQPAVVRSIA